MDFYYLPPTGLLLNTDHRLITNEYLLQNTVPTTYYLPPTRRFLQTMNAYYGVLPAAIYIPTHTSIDVRRCPDPPQGKYVLLITYYLVRTALYVLLTTYYSILTTYYLPLTT